MLAAVDVNYARDSATAGCILFDGWEASRPREEHVAKLMDPAPYVPGRLYLRELPCLMAVLDRLSAPLEVIIVDGYVWLDQVGTPGLGAHLWRALGGKCAIVGVAKSSFRRGRPLSRLVIRGHSAKPLYVSAAGLPVGEAARRVECMHGEARIPSLLRLVDRLVRRLPTGLDLAGAAG